MFDTAVRLKVLRNEKKRLDELAKANNATIEEAEQSRAERMILSETQSFNRGGTLFYLQSKLYASAVADRRDELYEALRREGYGDLVYQRVNANSLAAFAKEQIAKNDASLTDWLEGLVNMFEKHTVGMRKGGKSA